MKLADQHAQQARSVPPRRRRYGVAAITSGALIAAVTLAVAGCSSGGNAAATVALAGNTTSNSAQLSSSAAGSYQVVTRNDGRDVTFNQLLGINNQGIIAGYYGSGAAGHPNKGYALVPPFAQRNFLNENFPGSKQTQVTGLNDHGVTVGFWSTQNTASQTNNNFGFYWLNGRFYNVNFPVGNNASPPVNQLLGVNNYGIAVGFYTNNGGLNRGYEYDIWTHRFTRVEIPGKSDGTAGRASPPPPSTTTAMSRASTTRPPRWWTRSSSCTLARSSRWPILVPPRPRHSG